MEGNLRYLVLGYRKYTGTTQRELARELEVPIDIVVALEMGSYRHPTKRLMSKIEELTGEFEFKKRDFVNIGRGYKIREELGPDFKYFIQGLEKLKYINQEELKKLPEEECYKTMGSVDLDEFEVVLAGRAT